MNPEIKREGTKTLREMATAVFKPIGLYRYKAVESRNGDVILGGLYSEDFVKAYAKENDNVYIEMERR